MRTLLMVALAIGLAACGADPSSTKIADIDFADAGSVQAISQKLSPADRASFNRYVISRAVPIPGAEITRPDGTAPTTVREAIELAERRVAASKVEAQQREVRQVAQKKLFAEQEALEKKIAAIPFDATPEQLRQRVELEKQRGPLTERMRAAGVTIIE